MAESKEELKSLLMRVKEESERADLKLKKKNQWHHFENLLLWTAIEKLKFTWIPLINCNIKKMEE